MPVPSHDRPLLDRLRSAMRRVQASVVHAARAGERDLLGWAEPPHAPARLAAALADQDPGQCTACGGSIPRGAGDPSPTVVRALDGCAACRRGRRPSIGSGVIRLGSYEGHLRDVVLEVKFSRHRRLAVASGVALGLRLRASGLVDSRRTVVVPMPMPAVRRVARGIDHAAGIAAGVVSSTGGLFLPALAVRSREPQVARSAVARRTRPGRVLVRSQSLLPTRSRWGERSTPTEASSRIATSRRGRATARASVLGRLRRHLGTRRIRLPGAHIVLVDDVLTTGATARHACSILGSTGADRIVVGVLAVTPSRVLPAEAS